MMHSHWRHWPKSHHYC